MIILIVITITTLDMQKIKRVPLFLYHAEYIMKQDTYILNPNMDDSFHHENTEPEFLQIQ